MKRLFATILTAILVVSSSVTLQAQSLPMREANTSQHRPAAKFTPRKIADAQQGFMTRRKSPPSGFRLTPKQLSTASPMQADVARRAAAAKVKLRGAMTDNSLWYSLEGEKPYGIYELSTTPGDATYKMVKADQRFYVMDAVYTGDKLWISHAIEDPNTMQVKSMTYYTFNPKTWELLKEQVGDKNLSLIASTWDPTDETAYCAWFEGGFKFGSLSVEDGQLINIGQLDKRLIAMAAHNNGTLYAIDETGNLVVLNKQTGKVSKTIGNTGVVSYWRTSAAIDSNAGLMYYIDCASSKSSLYAVDLETAAATKLYDFENSEQLIGLYVVPDDTPPTVPEVPSNLSLSFDGGSLSGTISFDVPSTFYDGTAASGTVTYSVTIDGEQTLTGNAEWGKRCNVPVSFETPGSHDFTVKLVNSTGSSPEARISGWIGPDAPAAATEASAKYANGKFTVKWTAPTTGVNGGYLDASQLRYNVVRNPGNVSVASGITDTQVIDDVAEPENQIIGYTYTITSLCGSTEGESVTTSKKSIGYFIPPYENDFSASSKTAGYSVIDANKDGKKWGYNSSSKAMRIQYSSSKDMDDWVFTPAFQLEAGRSYTFSFKARAHNKKDAERIEAAITSGVSVSSVVAKIVEPTDLTSDEWVMLSGSFIPTTSGRYHLGLHAISPKNSYYLYATGISVSAGIGTAAPAAVTDFTATAAEDGSHKVAISMLAPATDVSGAPIASLDKVELMRNGELLETFESPAVGTSLTYEDTGAPAGNVAYSAVAYNASGEGTKAQVSVFVGFAAPDVPTDVVAAIGDNTGKTVLSWKAPEADINGRKLAAGDITYDVLRRVGDKTTVIKSGLTECTYSDQALAADAEQDFIIYGIQAVTEGGKSSSVSTQMLPLGKPYQVPFRESFANGRISTNWGLDSNNATAGWLLGQDTSIEQISSEDNDNGLAIMEAMSAGSSATLYSGSIAVPNEGFPVLSFAYYNHNSMNTLDVMIAEAGSIVGKKLTTVTLNPDAPEGWVNVPIDLSEYKGKNIQLYFTANVVNTTVFILDNIRIECRHDYDMAIRGISLPARIAGGSEYEVNVSLENKGLNAASGYSVNLLIDGEKVATMEGPALDPAETASLAFSQKMLPTGNDSYTYQVEIEYAADMAADNNKSEIYTVRRTAPDFPVPTNLTGTIEDGKAVINWTAPDLTVKDMEAVTDNASGYTPFSTGLANTVVFDDYVGGWTMVDNDGVVPFSFTIKGNIVDYPNSGRPIGFMVFDPSFLNLQEWAPHSGSQMFVSFASNGAPNDDWMISPRLSGKKQTVKFWARSLTHQYGAESFQFMYSDSDTKLSSFKRLNTVAEVPEQWTEYSFEVPEGTRWFAIRCTSEGTFALFVDDITFVPAHPADGLVLNGYNVYRDRIPVNQALLPQTSFTDDAASLGHHTYHVTAVYDRGESALSEPAGVDVTSISEIYADGKSYDIYSADGILLKRNASIADAAKLPHGIYIINGKKVRM